MADPAEPLREGNRVIESLARREALRALVAFSELHEQIRNRRAVTGCASDRDLFETERFILDEVLQLICERAQAITEADGVVVAFAEAAAAAGSREDGPNPERASAGRTDMVCRAAAGPLDIARGTRLTGGSEFLWDCLESGRILRADDAESDARAELDFARTIGARSSVAIPLRGGREPLGVLQAFSTGKSAFTDHDVRCFDLFAELVLCALKPEDQDRRSEWLAGVANEILQARPPEIFSATEQVPTLSPPVSGVVPGLVLTQPVVISAEEVELPEPGVELAGTGVADGAGDERFEMDEAAAFSGRPGFLAFPQSLSLQASAPPGLSVVMGLVAVAALFSLGVWWGMQVHQKTAAAKVEVTKMEAIKTVANTATAPQPTTTPVAVSDNAADPDTLGSDATPLTAVAVDKLAALPKVTGVRHWASSMGSTVVIDMEDQVPYEVHRLMSPERIYFDLHDTALLPELDGKTMDIGDVALTRVRIARPVAGVTRIVLDTKDGSNFSVSMESSPYRLVVELRNSDKALAANQFSPKNAVPKLTPAPVNAAAAAALAAKPSGAPVTAKTGKFRIVLDAGHGGWDLGTVGRQGLMEKDLVLDVTQRLGKLLAARLGSEVMFTRTDDTYLPLEQRADIANQAQADLFVSVHANYSSSAAARGVETYYTNLFSAPGSREVEKREDATSAKLTPVSLSAGGLHEKIEESRRLAASVQRSLYATLAASSPDIRNRGIKDSAFAVLTGTTMPAILTEISFVSSPTDERNLQSATYRQQIAEALYQGIARYRQASPHMKVAQLQTTAARQ
ncbi:MAG: N-acetylmuramoyl-L-alanine amidase [Terriglobales bacterium]